MDEVLQKTGNFLPRAEVRNELAPAAPHNTLVVLTAPASVAAEQYRVLHHRIARMSQARPVKLVALTSALAGEGKSLTATNLALVAAAADAKRKVLLIDADLRRPRVHELLDLDARPGLGEFLAGDVTLPEAMRRVSGSPLLVIPAGAPREDAGSLIHSPAMRAFLEQVRTHFDEIYLDVPPTLAVADGVLLAGLSDAAILVVRAGSTSRNWVNQAIETLAGTPLLGCVLNGVDVHDVPYLARNRVRGG